MTPSKRFSQNLRGYRTLRRVTQQQLGDRVGLDQSAISRLEKNQQEASITQLVRIAKALKVKAETLLFDEKPWR